MLFLALYLWEVTSADDSACIRTNPPVECWNQSWFGLPESLKTLGSLEVKGQVTLALLLSSRRLAFISGGVSCFKHDFKQAVRSDSRQPRSWTPQGSYFEGARLREVTCWVFYCLVSWPVQFFGRYAARYISHLPSSWAPDSAACFNPLWLCPFSREAGGRIIWFSNSLPTGPAWLGWVSLPTELPPGGRSQGEGLWAWLVLKQEPPGGTRC